MVDIHYIIVGEDYIEYQRFEYDVTYSISNISITKEVNQVNLYSENAGYRIIVDEVYYNNQRVNIDLDKVFSFRTNPFIGNDERIYSTVLYVNLSYLPYGTYIKNKFKFKYHLKQDEEIGGYEDLTERWFDYSENISDSVLLETFNKTWAEFPEEIYINRTILVN